MPKKAIFDKKNILITGGAGFIGSFLCEDLVKENKVICVDNFISGDEKNIDHLLANPDFVFIKHDMVEPLNLESKKELEKFRIQFQGVQEIYNLACPTSPKNFMDKRIDTILANSYAVKNTLDLALKYKAQYMHFSSSVVYGPRREDMDKFDEEYQGYVDVLSQRASYDEGKRFAESLVSTYGDVYDLDVKIARVFRTYGPRMKLNDGQMLPDFVSNALDGADLTIFGDEDFTSTFLFVKDLVSGAKKFMKSNNRGPYNFGGEELYKLVDVAKMVIEQTRSKSQIVFQKPLLFMSPLGVPNVAKVKEELSWFPITLMEDGIKETIDYLRANKPLMGIGDEII